MNPARTGSIRLALTAAGCEVLTPFQASPADLTRPKTVLHRSDPTGSRSQETFMPQIFPRSVSTLAKVGFIAAP